MEIDQDPAGIYQGHIHQLDSSLLNEIADDETSCPDDDIVNEVVELLLEDDTKEGMEPELMEMNNMMTEEEVPARSSFRQVSDASSQPATVAVTPTPTTDEEIRAQFEELLGAFHTFDMSEEERDDLFRVLTAILHLGLVFLNHFCFNHGKSTST